MKKYYLKQKRGRTMKEKLLKALDELLNEYDAYYFINKYDNFESDKCTHHK